MALVSKCDERELEKEAKNEVEKEVEKEVWTPPDDFLEPGSLFRLSYLTLSLHRL